MYVKSTQQVVYTWPEFGEVVENISEWLDDHLVNSIRYTNRESAVLAHAVALKLRVPVNANHSEHSFTIALDNLIGTPDIVVTEFHHDENEFQFHKPLYSFDQQVVDVEGRSPKIYYPW